MKKTLYLLTLSLAAYACSPVNEEVQDEYVEVAPIPEALDTITSTRKDAVQTDENETDPTLPMPQPVMQLLTEQYEGWEKPTLAQEASAQAENYTQGPMIVRGDFNGDTYQDLALQLRQGNNVVIVAALQEDEENYELYELKRDILFNDRGTLKSLYYLYSIDQGEELHHDATNEDIEAPHDAIAVGVTGDTSVYLFQDGEFEEYTIE
ncbi:hypothetical protein [Pontibacter pamirensis]|uniref:hypothetical protein n=1 Tax=Pontibacter pamirensis TaxID=2562824 RepID=UPI00138A36C1|nr:hypothetical protein [Pontibacter pamirensis]